MSLLHSAHSAGAPWDSAVVGGGRKARRTSGRRAAGGGGGASVSCLPPPPPAPPPGHLDIHIKDGPGKATYLSVTARRRGLLHFFFFSLVGYSPRDDTMAKAGVSTGEG